MLGEKIGDIQAKTTGVRVVAGDERHDHHGPKMEISFQGSGKVLGVELTDVGTYEACMQAGAFLKGTGQGISMTKDGEVVTWSANGTGKPTGGMGARWRGAIYYQTTCSKLARLNGMCCLFEYDVDEVGNAKGGIYEWK